MNTTSNVEKAVYINKYLHLFPAHPNPRKAHQTIPNTSESPFPNPKSSPQRNQKPMRTDRSCHYARKLKVSLVASHKVYSHFNHVMTFFLPYCQLWIHGNLQDVYIWEGKTFGGSNGSICLLIIPRSLSLLTNVYNQPPTATTLSPLLHLLHI